MVKNARTFCSPVETPVPDLPAIARKFPMKVELEGGKTYSWYYFNEVCESRY